MKQSHSWRLCIWTWSRAAAYKELKTLDWGKKKKKTRLCGRRRRRRKKKKLWSPLLLGLIKFSALITIKPLSMYNNVCITEQHRCSPSTQLNIKMAAAVLIAMRCVCVCVCLCLCVLVCVCVPVGPHRVDSPGSSTVVWRPAAPSLVPPVYDLYSPLRSVPGKSVA